MLAMSARSIVKKRLIASLINMVQKMYIFMVPVKRFQSPPVVTVKRSTNVNLKNHLRRLTMELVKRFKTSASIPLRYRYEEEEAKRIEEIAARKLKIREQEIK